MITEDYVSFEIAKLLKDLCDRLLYGVIYHRNDGANIELREIDIKNGTLNYTDNIIVRECKPYLRPMSSMTKEEDKEWQIYKNNIAESCDERLEERISELHNWFNCHHFDIHHLIEKGLALEAKEGMYKTELL